MGKHGGTHETNASEMYSTDDSDAMQEATERVKRILDAKYEPANLDEIVENCNHLNKTDKRKLYHLLKKYEILFDGSLGHWKDGDYNIELKSGAEPYHARPYPVPKVYEKNPQNGGRPTLSSGRSEKSQSFRVGSAHFHNSKEA